MRGECCLPRTSMVLGWDCIVKVPKPRPRCCVVVREKVVAVEFQHVVGCVNGKSHLEGWRLNVAQVWDEPI